MIWSKNKEDSMKNHNYCKPMININSNLNNEYKEENKNISYFREHWQGELSLTTSFWINFVLIYGVLNIQLFQFAVDIDYTSDSIYSYLFVILLWIFTVISGLWVLVGLWRSARNHIKRYNVNFWANVVRVMVAFGCYNLATTTINTAIPQVVEFSKIILNIEDIPPYKIKTIRQGNAVKISGGIRFGLTNEIKKYFDKYPNIELVHLDSIGGRILEGHKLSAYLKSKKISTYIAKTCNSACIDVFLAGKYRIIDEKAKLGFHQPTYPGLTEEEFQYNLDELKQYYINQGLNVNFVDKVLSTPHETLWKPSTQELKEAGVVNVVTDLKEISLVNARKALAKNYKLNIKRCTEMGSGWRFSDIGLVECT